MENILLLLVGAIAVTVAARKLGLPAPLLVTGVAIAVSFIPGVVFDIDPEVILTIVLPPLLFSAALDISFQDFANSLRQIRRLGIMLVILTALIVGGVANILVPDITLPAALLIGAIVAPPDAVSATAIGKKLGLPRRVMTVLSGESLINDAAALTLFKLFLVPVLLGAGGFGQNIFGEGALLLLVNIVIGVGFGLLIAIVVQFIRERINDPLIETVIGLLVPFVAYIFAEQIHFELNGLEYAGSGVLAVVAAGLSLGYNAPKASYTMRLQEQPIWASLDVLLEAFVFALIGLQFKTVIVDAINSPHGLGFSLGVAFILLGVTILVRPAYVFMSYYRRRTPRSLRRQQRRGRPEVAMSWQDLTVISWTGMRGVVTLASAATVTALFKQGQNIPAHDIIYLTAFVVTIGTLLIQGVTLPLVIKWLKVTDPDQAKRDAAAERALVSKTYQVALEEMKPQWQALTEQIGAEKTEKIIQRIQQMAIAQTQAQQADEDLEEAVDQTAAEIPGRPSLQQRKEFGKFMNDARRQINNIRREVIIRERDAGNLDEEVMRTVLTELDAESFAMDKSWQNRMRA
ncbi:cation:proton antiporter [Psychromicrobium lacuslunae]|uniref:Na(+)/H(+) antiporter n=1 Tax=Psychromicrobium lacuslunae TaxID=1618207 RepID=A0A0D4C2C9_9MICC|nr:sodium:proton antiporter [Psychromicrobium lacuslunae]AJT42540.1 Na(+)/H(+) antiporter [Psychromicrobium lacuslunae]